MPTWVSCVHWTLFALVALPVMLCLGSQDTVDYMAANLQVSYKVVANYDTSDGPSGFGENELTLRNDGDQTIADEDWSIYFCHIRLIYGTAANRHDGVPLGDSLLRVYHVNGCLHKISPDDGFELPSGESKIVTLWSEAWQVSRTDIMPNWYIAMPGAEPRTIENTVGQSLDFVADFTEPEQYKRAADDQYEPYTAQDRFEMYGDIEDKGAAQHLFIPTVVQENFQNDDMVAINEDWVIVSVNASLEDEVKFLAARLNLEIVADAPSFYIELAVGTITESSNDEAYKMEVSATSPESITITGNTASGVFWGIQSLLSLCNNNPCEIPVGSVEDYPRYPYRGMHIDVGRNFAPKDSILKLLDAMSSYKLNKLHFHLSDDEGWRLEIDGLGQLTTVGAHRCHDEGGMECIMPQLGSSPGNTGSGSGFYTEADYQEILRYADERHIQVIPEFDMPGHAHAAIKAMEARYEELKDSDPEEATKYLLSDLNDTSEYLSVQYFTDSAINPCINSTYTFIQHLVQQVKLLHGDIQPLEIFHFGGDEVPHGAWVNSSYCQDLTAALRGDPLYQKDANSSVDLMKYFVIKVAEIVKAEDLSMQGWEDGLIDTDGKPYDIGEELPGDVTYYANAWSNVWEWGGGQNAYMLANDEYKSVISHATHFYFDHPYEPDPEERGYYWATRFADTQKTFSYIAEDIYENIEVDRMGNEITREEVCETHSCEDLTEEDNLIGLQGQLWSETVRTGSQLDYMIFPRLLAMAERAWHKASWEEMEAGSDRDEEVRKDWEKFANTLGYKELARLGRIGIDYSVPPPGAVVSDGSDTAAELTANTAYPGLPIKFSVDGGATWCDFLNSAEVPFDTTVLVKTMSSDGSRSSRVVSLPTPAQPSGAGTLCGSYLLMLMMSCFLLLIFN